MSADSPASILFDQLGNPVGVIYDVYVYRLQTQSQITDGYGNIAEIVAGALAVTQLSTNGNITAVAAVNTDTLLLAANVDRRGVFIYNDTTGATIKIGLSASTVSSSNFSVQISAGGLFEIPFGYTGEIRAIWSVTESGGFARITELSA